ncbi:MAG: hypothetical protein QXJ75_03485 [Candidatus Bathyarchaeia archaeon]
MAVKNFGRLMKGRLIASEEDFGAGVRKYIIKLEPAEESYKSLHVVYSDGRYEVSLTLLAPQGKYELFDGNLRVRGVEFYPTLQEAEERIRYLFST